MRSCDTCLSPSDYFTCFIPCRPIHVVTDGESLFSFYGRVCSVLWAEWPQVYLMSLVLDPSTPLPLQPSKNGIELDTCEDPFSFICLQCRRPGFHPWVRKILWRRAWQPTPVLLPGESHGQRRLVGYSPWGHKGSDTTEQLILYFLLSLLSNFRAFEY